MLIIGLWVIGMQLIELIVHEWDMRTSGEPSAQLTPFAVEPVLTVLPETQMRFVSHRLADDSTLELKDGDYGIHAGSMDWTFRVQHRNVTSKQRPAPHGEPAFIPTRRLLFC